MAYQLGLGSFFINENGFVLCVNIMGGQDPLINLLISNRCDDIMGDGVEPLQGWLFSKDMLVKARWDTLFNSIVDTGQKFWKLFSSLSHKIALSWGKV